jgi:purine-nucleoside phosphorylase
MDEIVRIREAAEFLRERLRTKATVAVVLGSGLGGFADSLTDIRAVAFSDIPGFPGPAAVGHDGRIVAGLFAGVETIAVLGRYHLYEGLGLADVVLPIRVLKLLGVSTLVLTNACGAVNPAFAPGDLMVLTDHINLTGSNPLVGRNIAELGVRFPDASAIYDPGLRRLAARIAAGLGIVLREGVYAWWTGPSYETPAEIRMIRALGADAVGMSTVPEALAASHMRMKVLAVSCLTNMATGIRSEALTHEEVLATAGAAEGKLRALIAGVLKQIAV